MVNLEKAVFNEMKQALERLHTKRYSNLSKENFYSLVERKYPQYYFVFKEIEKMIA